MCLQIVIWYICIKMILFDLTPPNKYFSEINIIFAIN